MKGLFFSALSFFLVFFPGTAYSQAGDDFGFGGGDAAYDEGGSFGFDGASSAASPSLAPSGVRIGGEVSAEFLGFTGDFDSWAGINGAELGDIFSGALNFSASGAAADAVINLSLSPTASPVAIDEAYARVYFGPVNIEGGIRKLAWGRADSFGPLDVINPVDYTDLTKIADPMGVKLARPLAHISWSIGNFSKLEGVFVPGFQGHSFSVDGRWAPSQIKDIGTVVVGFIENQIINKGGAALLPASRPAIQNRVAEVMAEKLGSYPPDTASLQYAQAGLRFTTTFGSSDFGFQYYFGRLPRPAINITAASDFIDLTAMPPSIDVKKINVAIGYNSYHQIGVDFARVIAGFNTRAEAAVNITEDLKGDRGDVYNPSVAWSAGFDRDLIAGINVNVQAAETIRLFHDKIGKDPMAVDTEDGKDLTSTRITLILSKKFLRDKLEIKAVGLWDIEEAGFLVMPGIAYSSNDVSVELQGGIFGGERDGELGQYRDNHFVKAVLTYSF